MVDRGALEKELVSIDENFVGKDLSKIEKEISAGGMIGVYNLINNNPSSVTCKVQGDSELIMLQKSQILEALNDEKSELYAIIKEELTG